jgi:hypothetical protein
MFNFSNKVSASKAAQLADKRLRCEGAYLRAVGAQLSPSEIRFAGSAMQEGSARGAIANTFCAQEPGGYTYAAIAKAADVSLSDLSKANLDYVARAFAFRVDLVGLVVSFDDTGVLIRRATRDEKEQAIRYAARITGRTAATVAAVSGFALTAPARKGKAVPALPAPRTEDAA